MAQANTKSYNLTAPAVIDFMLPAKVKRWYVAEHSNVKKGERMVCLTDGLQAELDVMSPADAVLNEIKIYIKFHKYIRSIK